MKIKKVNLDRKPLDTAYVQQKQDFQQLMSMYRKVNNPVWKQPLFYGVIGFASVAAVVVSSLIDFNSKPIENNITLLQKEEIENSSVIIKPKIDKYSVQQLNEDSIKNRSQLDYLTDERRTQIKSDNGVDTDDNSSHLIFIDDSVSRIDGLKLKASFPTISGSSHGNLKASEFCAVEGIEMDLETEVSSFNILYSVGLHQKNVQVKGNRIPGEVCRDMEKSGYEQMVFITDIFGVKNGELVYLPSLNFWVTW
jgi:hypothetical protein